MRKVLFYLAIAGFALLAASCAKETLSPAAEGEVLVTLNVAAPEGIGTKAFSTGEKAVDLYYAIYAEDAVTPLFCDQATMANLKTSISVTLVSGKKYDMVFWAQSPNSQAYAFDFTTSKDVAVDYSKIATNDDETDAFFAGIKSLEITNQTALDVKLYRPFSQVNVATTDLQAAIDAGFDSASATIAVSAQGYNKFNVLSGSCGGDLVDLDFDEVTFCLGETFPKTTTGVTYSYLSMNYLLMDVDKETIPVTLTITDGVSENEIPVANVPVQRNYRTNIYGALLTNQIDINVEIIPTYEEDFDLTDDKVSYDVTGLKIALAKGGSFTLTENIVVPAEESPLVVGKDLVLNLDKYTITNQGSMEAISVKDGATLTLNAGSKGAVNGGQGGDNAAIRVYDASKAIINAGTYTVGPDANGLGNETIATYGGTVEINGGTFKSEAAYNGFYFVLNQKNNNPGTIIVKGGTFTNYDPSKGDDALGGNFVAEGYSVMQTNATTWKVSKPTGVTTGSALYSAIRSASGGKIVKLDADIAYSDTKYLFTAGVGSNLVIDLNGHNLDVNVTSQACGILINTGATLTIKGNGTITNTSSRDIPLVILSGSKLVIEDGVTLINQTGYGVEVKTGTAELHDVTIKSAVTAVQTDIASAKAYVYGGYYECTESNGHPWTLNKVNDKGVIEVYGGKFVNFDPSNTQTESDPALNNMVAAGCTVTSYTEDGKTIYEVK